MNMSNVSVIFLLGRLIVGTFLLFAGMDSLLHVEQHLHTTANGLNNPMLFMLTASAFLICGVIAISSASYAILSNLWALRK